jgi:amidophosphoribosyltransferase
MSEGIKHECGLAFIRLLKPVDFYQKKYGNPIYGLSKLQLLLQKQRNRGQDGAGLATIKLDMPAGRRYISRKRCMGGNYLDDLFSDVMQYFDGLPPEQWNDPEWLKHNRPFTGELLLGHLRYGTHGAYSIEQVHPFLRQNNWLSRNLVLAGNFNLTNSDEMFEELLELGQFPKEKSDTVTVLEKIGHFLDDEVQRLFNWFKPEGYSNREINDLIFQHLDIQRLLKRASKQFDGGYVMAGMIGHGDAFVMRDPNGIRPAFYYVDDEVVAVASERPPLQTAFDIRHHQIREIRRGHVLIIKKDGRIEEKPFTEEGERRACSFERIYFSRGNDFDIYTERKKLGEILTDRVLKAVSYEFDKTVFSFIPNTAEIAFLGLIKGVENRLSLIKAQKIVEAGLDDPEKLAQILSQRPRLEKIVVKDAKMRTFIADESVRNSMVSHVYDVTFGIVRDHIDNLVLLDDSIVRGTTLRDSIIKMVARLKPKKIVIVSSAPQIRYPDCYGIDMSRMNEFVAFQAMIALLKENGKQHLLDEVYERCKAQAALPKEEMKNEVQFLYDQFTYDEVSRKIAQLITPVEVDIEVEIIYQSIEDLQIACPTNNGDWYFSGNYPTPGGVRVLNRSFIYYMEKKNVRAY